MLVRAVVASLVAVVGAPGATGALGALAAAEEAYVRPADGVFQLRGHGFGHGRGMSQWGAQGAALSGLGAAQILGFYYPGTQLATIVDEPIRVRLSADPSQLRVSMAVGLTVVETSGAVTTLPAGYGQWRFWPTATGLQLQGNSGTAWVVFPVSGATTVAAPLRFVAPGGIVRVWRADGTSTDYRGTVTAIPVGSTVDTVDTVSLEAYLRGVVPRESPASWLTAALSAQAVAARTYAARTLHAPGNYDICDTTACQVYGGVTAYAVNGTATALEAASTDAAVAATAGQVVRTAAGALALTEYSASSGGWTAPGGQSYLVAQADPYDGIPAGNSSATWTAALPAAALEARYPGRGALNRLVVLARNGYGEWGGRVTSVRLEFANGSVDVTGDDIRFARPYPSFADGLRSTWFTILNADPSVVTGSLGPGRIVWSPNHACLLVMQNDGNLVVYSADGRVLWSSWTFSPGSSLVVQADGNVVLYSAHGYAVWATMTSGSGVVLRLQDDGNLVLYSRTGVALWDSQGHTHKTVARFALPPEVSTLSPGQGVRSNTRSVWLVMQGDGNLVAYFASGRPPWNTRTFVPGSSLVLQGDGNLVVYRPDGSPAWASMAFGSGAFLAVQDDGNVVVKDGSLRLLFDAFGLSGNPGVRF